MHPKYTQRYFISLALILKRPRALAMVYKGLFLAFWHHNFFSQSSVCSDGGSHLRFPTFHSHGRRERNISIFFDSLPPTFPLLWYYFLNDIFRKQTLIIDWQLLPGKIHILKVSACPFLVDFRAEMSLQKDLHSREPTGTAQALLIVLFQDLMISKQF